VPLTSLTDTELLSLCHQQNDQAAFRIFYDRHWPSLYQVAYHKLKRQDVAEELTQDLFVKLWEARHQTSLLNPAAYLHTALKNLIIDHIRRHLHETSYLADLRAVIPAPANITLDTVQFVELTDAVHEALAELPEKTRSVFLMSRFEQLPVREIAQRLGLSEKAIEYHLTRSLAFLRHRLKDFALSYLLWGLLDK